MIDIFNGHISGETVSATTYYGDGSQLKGKAQADTGLLVFNGLTYSSSTTINIGSAKGYIVDNETNPLVPTYIYVDYAGETNKTVTTLGSGIGTMVLLDKTGTIQFQNTFPTSAQRKTHLWLGKIGHPLGTITAVLNEPDYITSPQAFARDLFQVLGPYVNDGVYAYSNGSNLNFNITSGNIHGNGINFADDNTTPNEINMGPLTPASFLYRTQTGIGSVSPVTLIDPTKYDNGGTITTIGGGSNNSTIQWIFCVPSLGFIIQYGQTIYANLATAVANIGRESNFVVYPNLVQNAILIGVLAVKRTATALNDLTQAEFFRADKLGQIIGAAAGSSTGTLQDGYNNSLQPQIITNSTLGALALQRGSGSDTDTIFEGRNGTGATTSYIQGDGDVFFEGRLVVNGDLLTDGNLTSDNYEQVQNNFVATTNATITTIHTIPTTSEVVYQIESNIIGKLSDTSKGITIKLIGSFKNDGGTITQIGVTSTTTSSDFSTATASFTISGTNILVRVTGEASTNISWSESNIIRKY